MKKLADWADDQLAASEKALKDGTRRIRDSCHEASKATGLAEQARLREEISNHERRQRRLRQEIFDVEDRILSERDKLVGAIRGKLQQKVDTQALFSVRWCLSIGARFWEVIEVEQ